MILPIITIMQLYSALFHYTLSPVNSPSFFANFIQVNFICVLVIPL